MAKRKHNSILKYSIELWNFLDKVGLLKIIGSFAAATVISIASYVKRLPWPITVTIALVVFGSVVELSIRLPELLRRKVKVALIPAAGPASIQLLAVRNLGYQQTLRAECTLLTRRNDPNALHRQTFRLEWDAPNKRAVTLRHGGSCNLIIATAGQEHSMVYLQICGLGTDNPREIKESSRWSWGNTPPEYDMEISIIGDGFQKPYVERFTLKAGKGNAAMELFSIDHRVS